MSSKKRNYSESVSKSVNVSNLKLKKSEIIKNVRSYFIVNEEKINHAGYNDTVYEALYNQVDNNSIFEVILENNTNDRSKKFMINYFNFLKGKNNFIEKSNEIIVYFFNTRFIGSGTRKDINEISQKFIFDVLSSIYSSDSSYAIEILETFILEYDSQNHIEKIIKHLDIEIVIKILKENNEQTKYIMTQYFYNIFDIVTNEENEEEKKVLITIIERLFSEDGGKLIIDFIDSLLYDRIKNTKKFFIKLYDFYSYLTPEQRDKNVYKKIFFPDEQKDNTKIDNEKSLLVLSLKSRMRKFRKLIFNIYDLYTSTIYNYTNIPNSPLLYLISKFYVMGYLYMKNPDQEISHFLNTLIGKLKDLDLAGYIDIQDRNGNTPLFAALTCRDEKTFCDDIWEEFILYVFNLKNVEEYSEPEKDKIGYYISTFTKCSPVYIMIARKLFPEQFGGGGKSRKRKSRRKRRRNKRKTRKAKKSGPRKSKKSRRRRRR